MSDLMYGSEAEVKEILLGLCAEIDQVPTVFTVNRKQNPRSLQRSVTFVIQTTRDNEALVNKIVKYSSEHEMSLRFSESDMDLQGGNFEIDYLFITADIYPNLI